MLYYHINIGFNDTDWTDRWYDDDKSKALFKKKVQKVSYNTKKILSGTKIRNILIEKLNVFTMTVFLVDSVLNNLGVKEFDWILYNYCKSVETLESSQEIINCLKNYKK